MFSTTSCLLGAQRVLFCERSTPLPGYVQGLSVRACLSESRTIITELHVIRKILIYFLKKLSGNVSKRVCYNTSHCIITGNRRW